MTESPSERAPRDQPSTGLTRRETIRRFGLGGAGLLGAGLVTGSVVTHGAAHAAEQGSSESTEYEHPDHLSSELVVGADAGPYGGEFSPPLSLEADHLDGITIPPPPSRSLIRQLEMTVTERRIEVANGTTVEAWTYDGSVPGPTLRATEGELIRIHFRNATDHDHNLHFHGRHSPLHDGWEPVPPGGETVYEIEAGPAGLHPYHCHTMPIDLHISKGLYGVLIVDPLTPRPPAHEIVLTLGGWDPDSSGRIAYTAWNGISGFYEKFPIKVPAGDPMRVYLTNMLEYEPIASFHLHAQVFDVYPTGVGDEPMTTTDVIALGQTERAILEFTLPERGRYMFHPHQHRIAMRGAMGWFSAI
jgi:FtsP/CotA-like multicopper oxidase with cupredoxin domain